jgi:hypothetical protein
MISLRGEIADMKDDLAEQRRRLERLASVQNDIIIPRIESLNKGVWFIYICIFTVLVLLNIMVYDMSSNKI